MHELIGMVSGQVRENFNFEDGTQCLSFLTYIF